MTPPLSRGLRSPYGLPAAPAQRQTKTERKQKDPENGKALKIEDTVETSKFTETLLQYSEQRLCEVDSRHQQPRVETKRLAQLLSLQAGFPPGSLHLGEKIVRFRRRRPNLQSLSQIFLSFVKLIRAAVKFGPLNSRFHILRVVRQSFRQNSLCFACFPEAT